MYEEFTGLLAAKVAKYKMGDGFASGTTLGPLINPAAVDRVSCPLDRSHICEDWILG